MKNLTGKLGLFALVVMVLASCKPKIDADFVNSLMGLQTKITESATSLKGGTESMAKLQGTFEAQTKEMAAANPEFAGKASSILGVMTSVLGERAGLLTNLTGLSGKFGDLLAKYKSGGIKLKDAKGQFDTMQGTFNDYIGKSSEGTQKFDDAKKQFMNMYQEFKSATKK